jgi:hypothetical protein
MAAAFAPAAGSTVPTDQADLPHTGQDDLYGSVCRVPGHPTLSAPSALQHDVSAAVSGYRSATCRSMGCRAVIRWLMPRRGRPHSHGRSPQKPRAPRTLTVLAANPASAALTCAAYRRCGSNWASHARPRSIRSPRSRIHLPLSGRNDVVSRRFNSSSPTTNLRLSIAALDWFQCARTSVVVVRLKPCRTAQCAPQRWVPRRSSRFCVFAPAADDRDLMTARRHVLSPSPTTPSLRTISLGRARTRHLPG